MLWISNEQILTSPTFFLALENPHYFLMQPLSLFIVLIVIVLFKVSSFFDVYERLLLFFKVFTETFCYAFEEFLVELLLSGCSANATSWLFRFFVFISSLLFVIFGSDENGNVHLVVDAYFEKASLFVTI